MDFIGKISTKKTHLGCISELLKAILTFDKKQNRKTAVIVQDKLQATITAGVTLDMLPAVVAVAPWHSKSCIFSSDKKFRECGTLVVY